ncbi:MAG TPA: ABC transporter permease [Candidatus Bathyarchaeota archaeon]|nr:ABC transporter permease [Candidatus Bathyarchaeota archaeon]
MNPIIGIAVKDVKSFFREKETVFWTIAFPVIILLLFSAIFGREIPFTANLGVVNHDQNSPLASGLISGLNGTEVFDVQIFENKTEALQALNATQIRAVITIPQNFSLNLTVGENAHILLVVDETNPDVARIVRSGVYAFLSAFYQGFNPNYTEPVSVVEEKAIMREPIGYKEHILPGILCYPLLFSSMVASTGAIVYEKHRGTLKRIRASPTRPLNVLFGKTFAALLQTAISILIIAVLAYFLLAPKVNWNLPLMVPIMFLGSINGIALGLIISCVGKSPQAASGAATTVGIVLQFFIGMYFPIEYLPTYLQQIGNFIPMTYAVQAVRKVMIQDAVLNDIIQPIITLAVSAIILYAIGVLLYKRWVEKE